MFKELDLSAKIPGGEFEERATRLRRELLDAQFALEAQGKSLIIVVAGLDGAGKGALAHRLNEWMDPRSISTNTFWEPSDEEESRPYYWRFWRRLPPQGQVGLFLGSWYRGPIQAALDKNNDDHTLELECRRIREFEQMLAHGGAIIVKLWLHVSKETREDRLTGDASRKKAIPRVTDRPYELMGGYKKSMKIAEQVLQQTDSASGSWHLVAAEDRHYRDLTAAEVILAALRTGPKTASQDTAPAGDDAQAACTASLADVNLGLQLKRSDYKKQLARYQEKLQDLAWSAYRAQRSVVAVFEGWDAAGKGSAIRRVTQAMDPRLFQLVQIAAPSDVERAQHYLWRFWQKLERDGRTTIFDRSWYGRVLVERVEGFATDEEWQRAYAEINEFESQLADHGCILAKFWLHLSPEEQLARFRAREEEPHKQHKITDDDWRNRDRWQDYETAVNDMIARTSTTTAPWTLVAAEDKPYARIQILKTLCQYLENALDSD